MTSRQGKLYLPTRLPGFQNAKDLTDTFERLSLSNQREREPEERVVKEPVAKRAKTFRDTITEEDEQEEANAQKEFYEGIPSDDEGSGREARDPLSSLPSEERARIKAQRFANSVLDSDESSDMEEEEDGEDKNKRKKKKKRKRQEEWDFDKEDQLHLKALHKKRREEQLREQRHYVGTPFDKSIDELEREMAEQEARWLRDHVLLDREEALFWDHRTSDVSKGDEYFALADDLLDTLKTAGNSTRSADQKRFHDAFIQTCAPHLYGKYFLKARERLLKKWKRQEFNMATMIMTPRRWGKSTATAMAAAVLMYLCREIKIVIISTTREMSKTLMDMIKKYYCQLPGADTKILAHNSEEFITKCIDEDETKTKDQVRMSGYCNSIKARASTVHGNKGITADIFLLDEAARIPQMIMDEVIAPMMMVKNTVMIALSTPLDSDNYFTRFFNKKNQDQKMADLFIQFQINLLCETCTMEKKDPKDCKHLEHLRPPWLVSDNAERVKMLMASDTFAREVLGAAYSAKSRLYDEECIDRLKQKPQISLRQWLNNSPPLMMCTFIDPAGGGDSDCAISTILTDREAGSIILAMASAPTITTTDVEKLIVPYMKHLASIPELRNVHHYLMVERNYGGGPLADAAFQTVLKYIPDTLEYRSDRMKPGVWTDQPVKNDAFQTFALDLQNDQISICQEWFYTPHSEKREDVFNKLFDQMGRIKRVKKGHSHSFSGKDGGRKDDLMIAVVHSLYYRNRMLDEANAKTTMYERRLEAKGIFDHSSN